MPLNPVIDNIRILLIEDDETDVMLVDEAFRALDIKCGFDHVVDGEEGVAYLRQQGKYAEKPRPDLILLDLNMPRKDGREFLDEIKSDPQFRSIPVVVFTSSRDPRDVSACYERHANSYIVKPIDFAALKDAMRMLRDFWFELAALPA